jgi:hypothetical protein
MTLRRSEAISWLLIAVLLPGAAAARLKPTPGKIVDAGSFGIFLGGRRIGTEKFQIEQQTGASVATSELTVGEGQNTARQSSELKLAANGDVQRYTWHELSPGKGECVVEPSKDFLVQRTTASPSDKTEERPYILTPATVILDDYVFSHRELLAWRYLAGACSGQAECKLTRAQFPVLIPRQRTSLLVTVEYAGREKVNVAGMLRELDRFNLQSEDSDWAMWFDQEHKLVRILIAAENVEVVRDPAPAAGK